MPTLSRLSHDGAFGSLPAVGLFVRWPRNFVNSSPGAKGRTPGADQTVSQLAHGLPSQEHFIFCSISGQPLDRHNVRNKGVVAAGRKAGLHGASGGTVTTHDLRKTFVSHLIVRLGLDPVRMSKIAGHANVSVTLNIYAEEFDKAIHRDDLIARINRAGFGAVEGVLTSC